MDYLSHVVILSGQAEVVLSPSSPDVVRFDLGIFVVLVFEVPAYSQAVKVLVLAYERA